MNPVPPKSRSDCTLDARLDSYQAELFFERLENGLSLREGVAWLLAEHRLTLSEMSLSRWAAKRRRARVEASFAGAVELIRADRAQAAALLDAGDDAETDEPSAGVEEYARASLLLANHALFAAQRDGEIERIAHAARTVTVLRNAQTRAQRAEYRRQADELARRRHEYAASREAILYEHRRGLLGLDEACEEMRDLYDRAFCSLPAADNPEMPGDQPPGAKGGKTRARKA